MKPKKKPLTQYVGKLSPKQAADGIAAACETARALVKDAELLLEHGRWPRAASLAILAIEEDGKSAILREILLARNDKELREEWRNYRTHTVKSVLAGMQELVGTGARSLDDFAPLFEAETEQSRTLDAVKQIGFYSEAAGEHCHWSRPAKAITESFARSIVELVKVMTKAEEPMSSAAELELWARHLGPVWKGPLHEVKQAIAACYAEAEAARVLRGNRTARDMTRFLFGVTQ